MVDRDPVTEPAGDMLAAHTLVELIVWLDQGGDERYQALADSLLGWKGKRLRDAIAETGVQHLGSRQTSVSSDSDPDELERLAIAAGLVLSTSALGEFVQQWLEMDPEDLAFRQLRLRALGGLVHVLSKRREQDIAALSVALLDARSELPSDEPAVNALRRVDLDGQLADHLYRQFGRGDAELVARIRGWLVTNAGYVNKDKHRVLRTASVMGHWEVVEAMFASGYPFGLPGDGGRDDPRNALPSYVAERLATEASPLLAQITQALVDRGDNADAEARDGWFAAIAARASEPEFVEAAALLPG